MTDDLISRQDAIDAMTNTLWHYPNECYRNLNEYEFAKGLAELGLKSVPSAVPEPQWIPCSERLPEKPNMYTVTDSKGDVVRFVFYDTESSREYWLRCAKAWMPLPDPYSERRTDE